MKKWYNYSLHRRFIDKPYAAENSLIGTNNFIYLLKYCSGNVILEQQLFDSNGHKLVIRLRFFLLCI